MKPLEPGCLALVAPTKLANTRNGFAVKKFTVPAMTVTVGNINPSPLFPCLTCSGDKPKWFIYAPIFKVPTSVCSCKLTRIDGGDPDAITETEKELEKCD